MHALELLIDHPWARHAVLTGVLVGSVCSLLSVVVVLKRMAFIGQGISHAGFGGVGTAIFLGLEVGWRQDVVVLLFCLASAVAIGAISRRRRIEPDAAIGILLVAAMAWGVLMDNLSVAFQDWPYYVYLVGPRVVRPSYERLMFGSLLGVGRTDVIVALVVAVAVVGVCAAMFKEIVFYTFDERVSRVFGVRTAVVYYLLLTALAVTVVLAIRLAGFILVSALLVLPGVTALQWSRRLGGVIICSWLIGLVGIVGGLWVSLEAGKLSSGPCIVAVLCVIFGVTLAAKRLLGLGRA